MKKLLLLFAVLLTAMISAKAQSPTAVSTSDNTVKAGDSFTVTVNITKMDLSCFAQYQQKMPEGFTATEIPGASDNANFYF